MLTDRTDATDEIEIRKNGSLVHSSISDGIDVNSRHMKYNVHVVLRDKAGNIKDERNIHNTVTTSGKYGIADQIIASPALGKPTHMAVGTGTPAANALGVEADRNALTSKTRTLAVITMVGDWAAGDGTGALTEAGIFDASSAGNMWLSQSFAAINKLVADTLSISWTLTVS